MRVTVCELPHEPRAFDAAWRALCEHAVAQRSELVLLPELAGAEPIWESPRFSRDRWDDAVGRSDAVVARLAELGGAYVVGSRATELDGRRLNQSYLWSPQAGAQPLRSKYFLPEEPGSWEGTWFDQGDPTFPLYRAGPAWFGVNICTELWALETYAGYAALGAELVLAPRATAAATRSKWLAAGVVAAVRSGAFGASSNRVEPTGACGGAGWIVDPAGKVLASTSAAEPFATRDLDLGEAWRAKASYPRCVFPTSAGDAGHG